MKIALRVDVDTLRGTRHGVPSLLRTMDRHGIRAAYFFSVGPDNMGRHLWRLLKPAFLWKMLRTEAAGLYGLDILFMGTAWPGPKIAARCRGQIRSCAAAGHEIGVHAWDHHAWQSSIMSMPREKIRAHLRQAHETLAEIIGRAPDCSAAPGWRCSEDALLAKDEFAFRYNSDCRGRSLFVPVVAGARLRTPQIPLNLPTYDELLGRDGVTERNYNRRLLDKLDPAGLNLLTIHAEAEGGRCAALFEDFIALAQAEGHAFIAPGDLLPADVASLPSGRIVQGGLPGREGTLALQQDGREGAP